MSTQNPETFQQSLDAIYAPKENFFYESIKEKIASQTEIDKILDSCVEAVDKGLNFTRKQFEILGGLCYFIGIDYTNQLTLNETISQRVAERFKNLNLPKNTTKYLVKVLVNLDVNKLEDAKEALKMEVDKTIVLPTEDKLKMQNLLMLVKGIVANSSIPVNMANATHELINKKDISYTDLLKMNSLINRQCKFFGAKAANKFLSLNNSQMWQELLNKALRKFDNQKFAVIYIDGIISAKESLLKFDEKILLNVLNGDLSKVTFPKIEEIKPVETPVEEISEVNETENHPTLTQEEFDRLMREEPVPFIFEVLNDVNKKFPENAQDIIYGFQNIMSNDEMLQSIYSYLKGNVGKIKAEDFQKFNINYPEVLVALNEVLSQSRSEYARLITLICEPIPDEILPKIINYVNSCIGDLILETEEQKQYLISQLIENQISTYKQLQQILELIDQSDITGNQIFSYVTLYKYIMENSEVSKIFTETENVEKYQIETSLFMAINDWFKVSQVSQVAKQDTSSEKETISE
jgi:hypothetical protein